MLSEYTQSLKKSMLHWSFQCSSKLPATVSVLTEPDASFSSWDSLHPSPMPIHCMKEGTAPGTQPSHAYSHTYGAFNKIAMQQTHEPVASDVILRVFLPAQHFSSFKKYWNILLTTSFDCKWSLLPLGIFVIWTFTCIQDEHKKFMWFPPATTVFV